MTRHVRKKKLVKTSLQLRLSLVFLSLSFVAALFQVILLNRSILDLCQRMSSEGDKLLVEVPGMLATNLLLTVLILVPVMIGVGVLVTHRVAGPVYRFETYLAQVARGEEEGPCRIRKGDELQELCQRINEAVEALKARPAAAPPRVERAKARAEERERVVEAA